jgi:hypothetical protein
VSAREARAWTDNPLTCLVDQLEVDAICIAAELALGRKSVDNGRWESFGPGANPKYASVKIHLGGGTTKQRTLGHRGINPYIVREARTHNATSAICVVEGLILYLGCIGLEQVVSWLRKATSLIACTLVWHLGAVGTGPCNWRASVKHERYDLVVAAD